MITDCEGFEDDIHMITDCESTQDVQLTGKNTTDSVCDGGIFPSDRDLRVQEQLIAEESTSADLRCTPDGLNNCECLGLHISNNPITKDTKRSA